VDVWTNGDFNGEVATDLGCVFINALLPLTTHIFQYSIRRANEHESLCSTIKLPGSRVCNAKIERRNPTGAKNEKQQRARP